MYQRHRVSALLLMGGSGVRFGDLDLPKQFQKLGDRLVYEYALEIFLETEFFDEILLVSHPEWIKSVNEAPPFVRKVAGGSTRQESSFLGLKAFQNPPEYVVIHDAVRPFVSKEIIQRTLDAAIKMGASDTCISSADTLVFAPDKDRIVSIPNRDHFLRGQTPQTFRYSLILEAHIGALKKGIVNASDDCRLVMERGDPVAIIQGSERNIKITTPIDLKIAEAFLYEGELCR